MIDFLKNNPFIVLYGLTLIISLIRYKFYYGTELKFLPILISYTLLNEILGILIRDHDIFQIIYSDVQNNFLYNILIYNIFDVVFFLYFYFIFWRIVHWKKHKNYIKYGAILFILTCIYNAFVENILLYTAIYALFVGSAVLIMAVSLFLIQLKKRKNLIQSRFDILMFWISIGLVVFHLFYPFLIYLLDFTKILHEKFYARQTLYLMIIVEYCCFIIGFLRMTKGKIA